MKQAKKVKRSVKVANARRDKKMQAKADARRKNVSRYTTEYNKFLVF